MKVELDQKRPLGLSELDLTVLKIIAELGTTGVTTIAKKSGVDRGRIYRSLENLVSMGVVKTTLQMPRKYSIQPVEDIKQILNVKRELLDNVNRQEITDVVKLLDSYKNTQTVTPLPEFTIIARSNNIWSHMTNAIKSAKHTVVLLVNRHDLFRMEHSGIFEAIKKSSASTQLLTDTNKIRQLSAKCSIIQIQVGLPGKALIIDGSTLYFSGTISRHYRDDEDVLVKTNDNGIIEHYKTLVKLLSLNSY